MFPDLVVFDVERKVSDKNGALLVALCRRRRRHVHPDDAAAEVAAVQVAALARAVGLLEPAQPLKISKNERNRPMIF